MSEEKDKKANQKQLNIELDEATAQGTYSNLAIINHSASEFVVDFVNIMPGAPKRLLKALGDNINRFEQAHGEIKDYDKPPIPLNFGPTGQA